MNEERKWPTYIDDKPTQPGMYLGLFHGRDRPSDGLGDWGYNGPLIGPCKWVHTTYDCDTKVCLMDSDSNGDTDFEIEHVADLLKYDGKYYGDWTVFWSDGEIAGYEVHLHGAFNGKLLTKVEFGSDKGKAVSAAADAPLHGRVDSSVLEVYKDGTSRCVASYTWLKANS